MRRARFSWRRIAPAAAAVLLVLGGLRYGLPLWLVRRANMGESSRPLPLMAAPSPRDRVMVLAPHCDDETLACGGLIAKAVQAGAQVRVVLLTNGDGFRYAAERLFEEIEVPPGDYLKMAAERQRESVDAVSALGLAARNVTFLGYPDGGTAQMWLRYWYPGNPYTSPHTRDSRNPYPNSLRPGVPYCGRSVIEDLKTVIAGFKPTVVFCPHPNDNHLDHWALYCCTLAALHEAKMLDRVKLRLYLVHRGDWPQPQGLHPSLAMSPPGKMIGLGTRWQSLPLGRGLARRKRLAIMRYHTQILVTRRFLLSFARSSELFGALPVGYLPLVKPGTIKVDGRTGDWRGIAPAIPDPVQDQGPVTAVPSADLAVVYAASDGRRLFVRLDLWKRASSALRYDVHIHDLSAGKVGPPRICALRPGRSSPGAEFRVGGRCIEMSVPWPGRPASDGIMLGAQSGFRNYLLDETACVLLKARSGAGARPMRAVHSRGGGRRAI